MRRRALLLALVAGGVAVGAGVAFGTARALEHDAVRTTAFARVEVADVPLPAAVSRGRDALERDHDARGDVVAVLGVTLAAVLAAGGFRQRTRAVLARGARAADGRRPRAPPIRMPITVHC